MMTREPSKAERPADTPTAGEGLRILIIDDDPFHAETVAEVLARVGFECTVATSGKEGARKIENDEYDVVLTDLKMGDMDGLSLLRKVRQESPETLVVLVTGFGDVKTAVEAFKQGAYDYLTKPLDMAELRALMEKAAERCRLARDNRELKRQLDEKFGFEGVIGNSPKMRGVIDDLKKYAPTSVTVLIQGETGTGKELVAKAIHTNSPRKNKPFAAMNCTALNENLLEDELFGHEPGSFTGADKLRKGRFEYANGGTLFLDEVGDMPLSLQAKLLRVLENMEVYRIGSNEPIKVNVRMISATNRDLDAAVNAGTFRRDLYHRLRVATIKLPPLRDRREDLPLLCAHFIRDFNKQHGKQVTGIAEPVRKVMAAYGWPGNVREVRNEIETMVVQDQDGILGLDDLPREGLGGATAGDGAAIGASGLVGKPLSEIERYYIEESLKLTNGNREEAAKMLGIGERTLYRVILDWKMQDKIKQALADANGNIEEAAKLAGLKPAAVARKIKKWGMGAAE